MTQLQAFKRLSTPSGDADNEPIEIDTRKDSVTGQLFVLWRDIQMVFPLAQYVKRGRSVVSFMVDSNYETLEPLRVCAYPDIVLDVVEEASAQASSSSSVTTTISSVSISTSTSTSIAGSSPSSMAWTSSNHGPTTKQDEQLEQQTSQLSLQEIDDAGQPIAVLGESSSTQVASSTAVTIANDTNANNGAVVEQYTNVSEQYLNTIMSGQRYHAEDIKETMSGQFSLLQQEVSKNQALQEEVLDLQRDIRKQQQLMIDRLAIIQSRTQALITQTFELHEYAIPRLFIVLPLPPAHQRRRDKIGLASFKKQFRLYFLCECGPHTMTDPNAKPHKIHVAKHEGYDLDRPSEFFEQYGSYVLTMMQMIKYGIAIAGIIVPPLGQLRVIENIETVEKSLSYTKEHLGKLVDETIAHIQMRAQAGETPLDMNDEVTDMDRLTALEGADLRQLQTFLNVQDQGRVLGNLYKTITNEGHVKWVCIDHYRENYRKSTVDQLQELVEANQGRFDEPLGQIEIQIKSRLSARPFYEALSAARGIHRLEIKLDWDVTLEDLRIFATAISNANIAELVLDGSSFDGPAIDFVNRNRRFDPLVQLLANRRLQSMALVGVTDFFLRISANTAAATATVQAPQLRVLSFQQAEMMFENKTVRATFVKTIEGCRGLNRVEILTESSPLAPLFHHFKGAAATLVRLRTLVLQNKAVHLTVHFSQGEIQDLVAILDLKAMANPSSTALFALSEPMLGILKSGFLSELTMMNWSAATANSHLESILSENRKIKRLGLDVTVEDCPLAMETISSVRAKLAGDNGLELEEALLKMQDERTGYSFVMNVSLSDTVLFQTDVNIGHTELLSFDAVIKSYGWSFRNLETTLQWKDPQAELLFTVVRDQGSRLQVVDMDLDSLTPKGVEHMTEILRLSLQLAKVHLRSQTSGLRSTLELGSIQKAILLLIQSCNKKIETLNIPGIMTDAWIEDLQTALPTKESLPNLKCLHLSCKELQSLSTDTVQWLALILSGSLEDTPESTVAEPVPTQPLVDFMLGSVKLDAESWGSVLGALDLTTLERLTLEDTNLGRAEAQALSDAISATGDHLALTSLTVHLDKTRPETVKDEIRVILLGVQDIAQGCKVIGMTKEE